ncbi:S8/S53 family peptidase [Litoreibacter arenae]|uniref:Peptidase S8/S53 domain-containing protein n=1 Tax=Litoreibacter arenae DSM 19593 TaxID=1123360 RepID=S9QPV5_9RHOB|nr:S8 family serine peptidase [Litoreibacter arenae]EPX81618.1 hypothetical protein thalar_00174 [Litoreibacter arenae DSM 19593]
MRRRIDQYTGPYERWVYGDDLGRPFSFPAIRDRTSSYFTALMDSDTKLPDVSKLIYRAEAGAPIERIALRYPPLWNDGNALKVRPFCFFDPDDIEDPALTDLQVLLAELLELFDQFLQANDPDALRKRPRYRVNFPINPASWTKDYDAKRDVAGYTARTTPPKAIIGVIDDGIPFANRTYLDTAGKTRISHCWLQSARSPGAGTVPFGREYSNGQIDDLIADHGGDEDTLYRMSGAVDAALPELGTYIARGTTHGAHVLSLAAGASLAGVEEPDQDDIGIIAVQLPNTIAWDTSGFGKEMYMLSAIHYIFERAKRIADAAGVDEIPVVINFSYGWSGGRHDGKSEMDAAIQELLEERRKLAPTYLVMPAGNTYDDKLHAQLDEASFTDDSVSIGWKVQPDDRTSSYLEVWLPEELDVEDYSFEVTPPRGVSLDTVPSLALRGDPHFPRGDERNFADLRVGGAAIGQISVDRNRGSRWRAMLALAPTLPLDVDLPGFQRRWASSGQWTVTLRRSPTAARLPDGANINIWVQRDDDPSELKTGGKQSYLEELDRVATNDPSLPRYLHPLGTVRGFGSLNGVANAALTTRVAGYTQCTGSPAAYSSAGGLRNGSTGPEPWGSAVDVCAVSDRSPNRPGSLGQGVRSGSRSLLVGTSGASPQVARKMVRALADGKDAFAGLEPQTYTSGNPLEDAHKQARLGSFKAAPLWAGG